MDQPLVELTPEERMPLRWWPQAAAVLLMALELGWVVPWHQAIAALGTRPADGRVWAVLAAVMAAAYVLALTSARLRLLRQVRLVLQGALLAVSLLAARLALHPGPVMDFGTPASGQGVTPGIMLFDLGFLVSVGFTLWVWQRGVALGSEVVRPRQAWRRFQVGLAALMLHTFAASFWRLPTVGLAGLTVYLFVGLLAVMLARISYVSLTRSARKSPFDRRWIAIAGIVLAAAVFLAAGAGALLTGQGRELLEGLRALLGYLTIAVLFLLSVPAILLSYILMPLAPLLARLTARPAPTPAATPQFGAAYPFMPDEPATLAPLPMALQMACFWLALAVVVAAVFLQMRRRIGEQGVLIVEGPESLLSEGDARRLARQAFQDFLAGLTRRARPLNRAAAAQRVRQIYADLLDLSAARSHSRPASATPLEFLPELAQAFPGCEADLQFITHAYVRVRYGEFPENLDDGPALEAAWTRVQAYAQRWQKKQ